MATPCIQTSRGTPTPGPANQWRPRCSNTSLTLCLDAHTTRDPGGCSANFTLLETTSDPATWNIQVHSKKRQNLITKRGKIRRPSYLRLARGLRQDPWHIPTAQQQLPPWNQDRTHLTGKDTREETKTRLWTSNHSRSPHLKKEEPRWEQLAAGAHCPAK